MDRLAPVCSLRSFIWVWDFHNLSTQPQLLEHLIPESFYPGGQICKESSRRPPLWLQREIHRARTRFTFDSGNFPIFWVSKDLKASVSRGRKFNDTVFPYRVIDKKDVIVYKYAANFANSGRKLHKMQLICQLLSDARSSNNWSQAGD